MDSALSLRRTRGEGISSAVFNECIADEFLCVGLWEVMQPLDKRSGDLSSIQCGSFRGDRLSRWLIVEKLVLESSNTTIKADPGFLDHVPIAPNPMN
jgi:hypothetical protein